jgi:hypothetical protein
VESLLVDKTADETLLGEVNFYRGLLLTLFQGDAEGAMAQFEAARERFSKSPTRVAMGELEIEPIDAIAHQMVGVGDLFIQSLDQRVHSTDKSPPP